MSDEQLQFAISQYVDGTLPTAEVAALEKRLREDPAAQRLLEEYRRIGDLVQVALPAPEMDWDKLSKQISAAIDRQPVEHEAAPTTYRIGFWKPLAMAAGVLLCATVAILLTRGDGGSGPSARPEVAVNPPPILPTPSPAPAPGNAAANTALARSDIHVLIPDRPEGTPVLHVQIGPAPDRRIDIAELYPDDDRSSVSIAGDPSRMAVSDDFGMVQ